MIGYSTAVFQYCSKQDIIRALLFEYPWHNNREICKRIYDSVPLVLILVCTFAWEKLRIRIGDSCRSIYWRLPRHKKIPKLPKYCTVWPAANVKL